MVKLDLFHLKSQKPRPKKAVAYPFRHSRSGQNAYKSRQWLGYHSFML